MTHALHIVKLHRTHNVEQFTCGQPELDRFLIRHALQAQQSNSSQTYVALSDSEVVGFYTIVAGEVQHAQAPQRVVKGMSRHPIPLLVLARLAVHSNAQGRGLGSGLLLDALGRTLQVADVIGVRALAVHAKDDQAAAFYRHFGFVPSPTDARHLFMIIKDIRLAAGLKP
ncbi:GNAT family N-acetyltransferase [Bradyrhizobium erythrophlei]|uniref:Acetyltransferase (GNAT) domain-containing protein n=1 Tax=Bradyrhizobium erythrophlei TaxID=1437360 RepID=A0A1M5X2Z4_9BRAD|nr:GNAT family N-acetyltransferase [Bradyrhizobium erythrophlei]SHH93962.1 Acetyltransferase (GNAT) domain-containing protein [Bradyrhizobium erythrophlei]